MNRNLDNQIAIVTGGASGIGAGIVRQLITDGAKVMIADIDDQNGLSLAGELCGQARFVHLDVTDNEGWSHAFDTACSSFGVPTILVNNAAISISGSITSASETDWRHTIDVNCTGSFLGCQHAVATMASNGGTIINIASARGKRVSAAQLSYSCSKALLIRLTEGVALHCAEQHLPIRCNAICPGVIDTPILAPFYEALGGRDEALRHFGKFNAVGRLGTLEEIAAAVSFLASPQASFITGATLDVDGGFGIRDR
jgi:NAD(P)-dependent dehydrogenase (short-subunit alcohol dehydrogenase family)